MVGNGQRSVSNPGIKINISALLVGTALTLATEDLAFAQDKTVKIGALSDQSGTLCPISEDRDRPWLPKWRLRIPA